MGKKKAKKIEEGLKSFLQNWDLENVFFDEEQNEGKREKDDDIKRDPEKRVDNLKKKHKEFKQKKEKRYNKHKKDERHKKYDAKEKNNNDVPQKVELNEAMSPDSVTINQKNNNHNKKKEYSAW